MGNCLPVVWPVFLNDALNYRRIPSFKYREEYKSRDIFDNSTNAEEPFLTPHVVTTDIWDTYDAASPENKGAELMSFEEIEQTLTSSLLKEEQKTMEYRTRDTSEKNLVFFYEDRDFLL